jgi:hypothetical protein
MEAEAMEE